MYDKHCVVEPISNQKQNEYCGLKSHFLILYVFRQNYYSNSPCDHADGNAVDNNDDADN